VSSQVVHAAVASSAPVLAKLDMQGYNDVTAAAYSVDDNNVGGSAVCEANIRAGHATIKTMFDTAEGAAPSMPFLRLLPPFFSDTTRRPCRCAGFDVASLDISSFEVDLRI